MNMLTSLKDMLSPTSPLSLGKGAGTPVDPAQGASDFAQMLDTLSTPSKMSAMPSVLAAPVALDVPAAPKIAPAISGAPAALEVPATPIPVAEAPAAPTALDMPAAPNVAAGPSVAPAGPSKPLPATATPTTPTALDIPATTKVPGAQTSPPIVQATVDAPILAAPPAPLALPTVVTRTATEQDAAPLPSQADAQATEPAAPSSVATPVAQTVVVDQPILAAKAPYKPVSADPSRASISDAVASDPIAPSEASDIDDADVSTDDAAEPVAMAQPLTNAGPLALPIADATAMSAIVNAQPVNAPISPVVAPSASFAAPASALGAAAASSPPTTMIALDATAPTAAPAAKPAAFDRVSRSDAVSLLQLARDHMAGRVAPSGKDDAARPSSTAGAPSTDTASLPESGIGRIDSAMVQPSAPTMQPATSTLTSMPVVNLSASLGAQVVDMGVSGQWIDGLARDIAGLSANGAQGRFQIQADQLGPVQVDIRPGDGGSSVVLTVENAAAETALRRDSDQLRFDAGGSAARISDVKIERGPMAADATRPDPSSTQQQSAGQGQASNWQGQSAAQQHQQQARSQGRENPLSNPKTAADAVVINHGQTGDAGEPLRARYA